MRLNYVMSVDHDPRMQVGPLWIEPRVVIYATLIQMTAYALFDVPDGIRAAAQQGLDWREEYGRGGTASGVRTARALVSGRVEPELLITIAAWWARFSAVEGPMETDDGEPTALAIARALWGGDDAQAWADGLVEDARREVDGEMSAAADAPVSGILHLLRLAPPAPAARTGITHLLRAPRR